MENPAANVEIRGEGRALLFLHGWGASGELFAPITGPLEAKHRLILPDLPGFGKTAEPSEAWSSRDYGKWILDLLDRLEVSQCDVIGHSHGGRVALHLAAEHGNRFGKLILIGSAGIRPNRSPAYHARVRLFKLLRAVSQSRMAPAGVRKAAAARAARRGSADYRAASGVMRSTLVRLVNEDVRPLLQSIKSPVLLIWGENDEETPLADGRLMEKMIPDAGLVVFEGCGHYAYLEQPGRFCTIADIFLSEKR